jgi:hypothetical protein
MSKKAKNENKKRRREAKAARKKANYLRTGPKAGQSGRRMKKSRYNSFTPGAEKGAQPAPKQLSARGKKKLSRSKGKSGNFPNFPLKPIRKRFHLSTSQIAERRA